MIRAIGWIGVALISLALAGCGITPYKLPPSAESAKLKLGSSGLPRICVDHKNYSLHADKSGYATIPAGSRIIVSSRYEARGYNVRYSCEPRISFIPVAGESYFQDFQIEAEKCSAFVYREVTTNPVGLDLIPTMAAAEGVCTR